MVSLRWSRSVVTSAGKYNLNLKCESAIEFLVIISDTTVQIQLPALLQ